MHISSNAYLISIFHQMHISSNAHFLKCISNQMHILSNAYFMEGSIIQLFRMVRREGEEWGGGERQEEDQEIDNPVDMSHGDKSVTGHNPQQIHYFWANNLASPVVLENFW
jgi:hypothetical protein